jgi:hypothetical protein
MGIMALLREAVAQTIIAALNYRIPEAKRRTDRSGSPFLRYASAFIANADGKISFT